MHFNLLLTSLYLQQPSYQQYHYLWFGIYKPVRGWYQELILFITKNISILNVIYYSKQMFLFGIHYVKGVEQINFKEKATL